MWSKQPKTANKINHPETHVTLNIPEVAISVEIYLE